MVISAASCQAYNAEGGFAAIMKWVAGAASLEIRLRTDIGWLERYAQLGRSQIDMGWICGAPYVRRENRELELLVAPVMVGERYGGRPVYFTDLLVRVDHPTRTLADLHGATFAINEPNSQSGSLAVSYLLAQEGLKWGHFGRVVASGGHQSSLKLIAAGTVDAAAIDSTVFDTEVREGRIDASALRRIVAVGPMPIPPFVVGRWVPQSAREALKRALLGMHDSAEGRTILQAHGYARFHAVTDSDYDFIRHTHRVGAANIATLAALDPVAG